MEKKGNDKRRNRVRSTIKISPTQSDVERLQALIESSGLRPDQFKIHYFKKYIDDDGKEKFDIRVSSTLPEEIAEPFIKELSIKPFDPEKDTVTIGKAEFKLVSVEEVREPESPVKLWTGKERGKRSKPKNDGPDVT